LRSPILAALLHGTPAAGVSQTATWYKESQRVPPIFGWAAITLGIGPHSSFFFFFLAYHSSTHDVALVRI